MAFKRWKISNFCLILFLQAWSGPQMTCEGTAVVGQWSSSSETGFPINLNLHWLLKYSFATSFTESLVYTTWHRCQSTACVAFHMMWRASWLSVTFVKTGSMEGGFLDSFSTLLRQSYLCMYFWFICSVQPCHLCMCECFLCSCVGVEEDKAAEIDLYHCPNCQVTHGPSVSKSCRCSIWFYLCFLITLFDLSSVPFLLLFTVRKRRGGNKQTTDYTAAAARDPSHPVKTGSPQFVRELRSRTFPK